MKKLLVSSGLITLLLSSCATQKLGTYNDDVYANPAEERKEAARIAAIEQQKRDAEQKRYNDSIAAIEKAQKEKDDANPYYKDREFKYDDYYDYEYATRIRRFDNGIRGLSYYDNYYTNSYWYSNNPYNYGVSVYNGYSWWGPSYNAYSYNPSVTFYYNWGWGSSPYNGYNGYNPYYNPYGSAYWQGYYNGYNQGYNNGYWGYPYSGYGYGGYPYYGYGAYPYYGGGWSNPYYNGWGYYNAYDQNSSYTYGPRTSHGGGNSRRTSNPGLRSMGDDYYNKYVSAVQEQQVRNVKFEEIKPVDVRPVRVQPTYNGAVASPVKDQPGIPVRGGNAPVKQSEVKAPVYTTPIRNNPETDGNNGNTGGVKSPQVTQPVQQQPVKQMPVPEIKQPVKQQPIETPPRFEAPVRQNNFPSFPGGGNNNNGGGTVPSGGHRPR